MFRFLKKRKPENKVTISEIQIQPEQPEEKEPVRTDFKNGCFVIRNEDGQTLYTKDGRAILRDKDKTFIFQDVIDGEFVAVQRDITSSWTYEYHYDIFNADGLHISADTYIRNKEAIGPNLIMFPYNSGINTSFLIYSKVLKRLVSPGDEMGNRWFDGVIGIFNEDKELTAVKAVRDDVETIGYGTLMESKKYRTTYIIDLEGNIISFTKEEIKEEKNEQE